MKRALRKRRIETDNGERMALKMHYSRSFDPEYIWIFLIIWLVICGIVSKAVASNRGEEGGFWWGFLLGPLGLVIVALRPNDSEIKQIRKELVQIRSLLENRPNIGTNDNDINQIRSELVQIHSLLENRPAIDTNIYTQSSNSEKTVTPKNTTDSIKFDPTSSQTTSTSGTAAHNSLYERPVRSFKTCPRCQEENASNVRFCRYCGSKL